MSKLDEIKQRLERATPGPWTRAEEHEGRCSIEPIHCSIKKTWILQANTNWESDVDFIANVPTDIRWIIGEVERLRADLEASNALGVKSSDRARNLQCEVELLRSQLPEGMQRCKILFKQCELGHGWLTASNWVQHGCPTCESDLLRAMLAKVEWGSEGRECMFCWQNWSTPHLDDCEWVKAMGKDK